MSEPKPTRVLIADDHPIFRRGLREVLEEDVGFRVVAEAQDGVEALRALRELRPDIAVLDIAMPECDGLEVLTESQGWPDAPRVVLLSVFDKYVERAFELGASGYVLKEDAELELVQCLVAVASGERYVSSTLIESAGPQGQSDAPHPLDQLTETERRVLKLLAEFKTSREIAELLSVSFRTVQNHRASAVRKLGLGGAQALLRYAAAHRERL
ncbi:MAG: response regulator [Polyangiaceae bacterium]